MKVSDAVNLVDITTSHDKLSICVKPDVDKWFAEQNMTAQAEINLLVALRVGKPGSPKMHHVVDLHIIDATAAQLTHFRLKFPEMGTITDLG